MMIMLKEVSNVMGTRCEITTVAWESNILRIQVLVVVSAKTLNFKMNYMFAYTGFF